MTREEWIKKYNDCILEGLELGMIPTTIMGQWIQYQVYLKQVPLHKSKRQAILAAADIQKCDEKTIRNAIAFYK